MALTPILTVSVIVLTLLIAAFNRLCTSPLRHVPGPKIYALTKWRLALDDWRGNRTRTIQHLHEKYGPVVRIGPHEVHFASVTALRTIYGAGSGFERTRFYSMFDVYGKQNMFTFHSVKEHADRKKLLANAYSKSAMMQTQCSRMVEGHVSEYLDYIGEHGLEADEIFASLHYFSIDTITEFVYGRRFGGTSAVRGSPEHRKLLNDILDPARRRLSWFAVHLPPLTKWMYSVDGLLGSLVKPFLPMQKPATYSAIRTHALIAWNQFKENAVTTGESGDAGVLSLLWKQHTTQRKGGLDDLDIASECADHLLAGIDTTADTLMFLVWALSLAPGQPHQQKLIQEVCALPESSLNTDGIPMVEAVDKLPYLDAVIKETLRLYAPLSATEPRSLQRDTIIDAYDIPAGTTVGMAPFSLHRNAEVFPQPLTFDPERWLDPAANLTEMKKWFWAFSSGGRMCIGMHLAMAEMTTLVAAVYRKYTTSVAPQSDGHAPAITSRFELFFDETMVKVKHQNVDRDASKGK